MNGIAESLAYWYFRLNGFLTIENLVVHVGLSPERQGTDVDILGVRFPYRAELKLDREHMVDDDQFLGYNHKPLIILAEVKTAVCALNGPWTNPKRKNMQRMLYALGTFPDEKVDAVADALYSSGVYSNDDYNITLFCIGESVSEQIQQEKPDIPQITWDLVLSFIYRRFIDYEKSKRPHPQWNPVGQYLWDTAIKHKHEGMQGFIDEIKKNIW